MTPITPLEPGVEMFERGKTQSLFMGAVSARTSLERPVSVVSDTFTDIEDDSSEFEEFSLGSSVSDTCAIRLCARLTFKSERQPQKSDYHFDFRRGSDTQGRGAPSVRRMVPTQTCRRA